MGQTCYKCKKFKPINEFYRDESRKNNYSNRCKNCDKKRKQKHYKDNKNQYNQSTRRTKKRKKQFICQLKSNPCHDCQESHPYWVMQFDHVRGDKKFIINKYFSFSWKQLREEIKKCDLVCTNCHLHRTDTRRNTLINLRKKYFRHKQVFDTIKSSRPCADCNIYYNSYILQFDHCRGEKSFGISANYGKRKLTEILDEIKKCDIVCGNCHHNRTYHRKHGAKIKELKYSTNYSAVYVR